MITKKKEKMTYDRMEEPIVLSKGVLDLLLQSKKPSDCIALYTFLYYTAKWQKTNHPRATVAYIGKALNWGKTKTREVKKELNLLGLIENIRYVDDQNKTMGWYVKVNFIWGRETHPSEIEGVEKATHRFSQGVAFPNPNALSTNRVNASSTDNSPQDGIQGSFSNGNISNSNQSTQINKSNQPKQKKSDKPIKIIKVKKTKQQKQYTSISKKLAQIISSHKRINKTSSIHKWNKDIELLFTKDLKINGDTHEDIKKRIDSALQFYAKNIGGTYIPDIQSGSSFRRKFISLENAMQNRGYISADLVKKSAPNMILPSKETLDRYTIDDMNATVVDPTI